MRILLTIAILVGVPVIASAQPLPIAEYPFHVETYADFDARPGQISFDNEDNLFAGNFYLPGQDGEHVSVWKVSPLTQIPVPFGPPIYDPDALVVDRNGDLGGVGSVLVGGGAEILEVPSDGSDASVLFSGGCLANIQITLIDAAGRLFAVAYPSTGVCYIEETPETFVEVGYQVEGLAFGESGEVFLSYNDSIHVYDSEGVLLTRGLARGRAIGYCSAGVFEDLLQLIVLRDGDLISLNLDTLVERPILSGIAGSYVAFDSVGNLYLAETSNQRVLRVQFDPAAVAVPDMNSYSGVTLAQNSPNPFNPSTEIRFSLRESMGCSLVVYDASGRRVKILVSEVLSAGEHAMIWNGRDATGRSVPSGVYFARLEGSGVALTQKMTLAK